jgi:hypothetical protein
MVAVSLACKGADKPTPITTKILLRYHPPVGAAYHYALDQSSRFAPETVTADSAAANAMALAFTQTIGAAAGGGVPVTTRLDSARVTSPMLSPEAAEDAVRRLRGVRLTSVFVDRLRLVRTDFSALNRLPSIVGDQVLLGLRAAARRSLRNQLGLETAGRTRWSCRSGGFPAPTDHRGHHAHRAGDSRDRFGHDHSVVGGDDPPERPIRFTMGQPITIALRGSMTGEQLFSLTRGAPVTASLAGTIRVNVTGGLFGPQGMALRVDQQGTIELREAGP